MSPRCAKTVTVPSGEDAQCVNDKHPSNVPHLFPLHVRCRGMKKDHRCWSYDGHDGVHVFADAFEAAP